MMIKTSDSDGSHQRTTISRTKFENPPIGDHPINYDEGDQVEVKWRPDSDHAYLWYRAVIKTINWDYFICEFKNNENVNRDIFERDTIRLANPNPTNRVSDFFIGKRTISQIWLLF